MWFVRCRCFHCVAVWSHVGGILRFGLTVFSAQIRSLSGLHQCEFPIIENTQMIICVSAGHEGPHDSNVDEQFVRVKFSARD